VTPYYAIKHLGWAFAIVEKDFDDPSYQRILFTHTSLEGLLENGFLPDGRKVEIILGV
jgi:hypothetical protein